MQMALKPASHRAGGRNTIQAPRNKNKGERNKIQAQRNKNKIGRNEIKTEYFNFINLLA